MPAGVHTSLWGVGGGEGRGGVSPITDSLSQPPSWHASAAVFDRQDRHPPGHTFGSPISWFHAVSWARSCCIAWNYPRVRITANVSLICQLLFRSNFGRCAYKPWAARHGQDGESPSLRNAKLHALQLQCLRLSPGRTPLVAWIFPGRSTEQALCCVAHRSRPRTGR